MREIINTAYVAEVKEGKVVYFKEYTTRPTDSIPSRIIAREKVLITNFDPTIRNYPAESTAQAVDLAEHIMDLLNSSSLDKKVFFEQLDKKHRYLQSEFTLLCVEWFRHCAKESYQRDGRNEWCHELGVKVDKIT